MVKCERCGRRPAEFIEISNWRRPEDNWFAGCGCGPEVMYSIHRRHFWTDMANHVNEKRWSTPARIIRFIEIANQMDPGNRYEVTR